MSLDLWVTETHEDYFQIRFKVEETLYSKMSDFQQVDVVRTKGHGNMLLNDGLVMVSDRDEFVYHDMISHVPLFVHPNPQNVLIIGGGDGGTAREVLRHKSVKKCVMVEIDEIVVEACKTHFPSIATALNDPPENFELIIGDGVKYMSETKEKFDVILIDSTDPIGPATPLFGKAFYEDVHQVLSDDGLVVSQCENPFFMGEAQASLVKILSEVFSPYVSVYNYSNLTYPGGLWSFSIASKKYHPLQDFKEERVKESGLSFQYYNTSIHKGAFARPEFMNKKITKYLKE